jgi:hypothetical protein
MVAATGRHTFVMIICRFVFKQQRRGPPVSNVSAFGGTVGTENNGRTFYRSSLCYDVGLLCFQLDMWTIGKASIG